MESQIWNSLMKFDTRLNQVEETKGVFGKVGGAFKSIGNIVQTETYFEVKPEHKEVEKVSKLFGISSDEKICLLSVSDRIGKYDSHFVVTNKHLYLNSYLKEDDYISLQLPLGLIEGAYPSTDGINVSIKSSESNLKLKSSHFVNESIGDTIEINRLISELINELINDVADNTKNIFTVPITDENLEEFKFGLEKEINKTARSFALNNIKQEENAINALKTVCRKFTKEQVGKRPFTNINLVNI